MCGPCDVWGRLPALWRGLFLNPQTGSLQPRLQPRNQLIAIPVWIHPSETPVISKPNTTITAADSTGTSRSTGFRLVFSASGSQCFAHFLAVTTIMPIAISTPASPRLNATNKTSPAATWPSEIELSSSTIADSHGTNPPLAPSAIRLPIVTSPSGMWVCPPGPW